VPVDLWGQLDPPPLPLGLLPAIIEQLALSEGIHMGCDPAGIAISALVVCASVISDEVKLQVKKHNESWTECARLWEQTGVYSLSLSFLLRTLPPRARKGKR
jgi:hypothetical protein